MKGALARTTELMYELLYAFYNTAQNVWHMQFSFKSIFETELFQTMVVHQRQHVN